MRKILVILICIISIGHLKAQEIYDMPTLDSEYPDIDTLVNQSNYLLNVNVDTLYIINKAGLLSYEACRNSYGTLREETKHLIQIQSVIENVDKEFGLLNKNLSALEVKYGESLKENVKTNTFLQTKNTQIESELKLAQENLKNAKQKIKAEKWKSTTAKIIWGVGGALVGGTLIAISK